jgi:hypothetical protein
MALIVDIRINNKLISTHHAIRLQEFKGEDAVHLYETNNGDIIEHKFSDGAVVLATKILQGEIREV